MVMDPKEGTMEERFSDGEWAALERFFAAVKQHAWFAFAARAYHGLGAPEAEVAAA